MKSLVLQSDFGKADGAVCAMYGVAQSVSGDLKIFDLTHDIPEYDIWEASYRLIQTTSYWPAETVFVSVVDPGVGSSRKSVAVKTALDHYIITPDNGTLTHIIKMCGIKEARLIDEERNRLPGSSESYTFHGRDIYAYNGARLAAGLVSFEDLGDPLDVSELTLLPVIDAHIDDDTVCGTIDVLDVRYGSLWTNVDRDMFRTLDVQYGDRVEVSIVNETRTLYRNNIVFARSFADVFVGEPLIYVNSLDNIAVAINQGSFSKAYNIGTGNNWHICFKKTNL